MSKEEHSRLHASQQKPRRGYHLSEEHKKHLSDSLKGKRSRLGAVLSQETKDKISSSLKTYYKERMINKNV